MHVGITLYFSGATHLLSIHRVFRQSSQSLALLMLNYRYLTSVKCYLAACLHISTQIVQKIEIDVVQYSSLSIHTLVLSISQVNRKNDKD